MRPVLLILFVLGTISFGGWKFYSIMNPEKDPVPETETVERIPEKLETIDDARDQRESEKDREKRDAYREQLELAEFKLAELQEERERKAEIEETERERREAERIEREKQFVIHEFKNREAPGRDQLQELFESSFFSDPHSNSVVVSVDTADRMNKVSSLLASLDVPSWRSLYRIEGIVVTAQLGDSDEFSIDWLGKFSYPKPVPTIEAGFGSGRIDVVSPWLNLAIEKARTAGRLAVLSRPALMLSPGQSATISSGREIPIPVTNVQDGNAQTSIEFRRVALQLDVTLNEIGSGRMALEIAQVNDSVDGIVIVDGSEVPQLSSQQWETQIEPEFGEWYAIGGVVTDEESKAERKGWIFRNRKSESNLRREIGMFVRVVPVSPEREVPTSIQSVLPRATPLPRAVPVLQSAK